MKTAQSTQDNSQKRRLERGRMAGPPSGNAAPERTRRVIDLTKAEQMMAETRYKKLAASDPRKAWKKWAETVRPRDDDA
jgi:hypothetical protein